MPTLTKVTEKILEEITPTVHDRKRICSIASELERKVSAACAEAGLDAVVRVEGSVAKDTWLREEPDVDVFMRLPVTIPRKALGEIGLKIAKKATEGSMQIERFAEHPYLEAFVDGTRVNIVPCYQAKPGEWLSATDRTPYHTDYVNEHLAVALREEVRLLKKFMKGISVYGAEIRIGGFSGYLCELLTLHYGSFAETLAAFSKHSPRRVVDIESYYKQRERELELLFPEPLVVVDPVDRARNVASAVRDQMLQTFAAASRAFLKAPRKEFFYPPKTPPLTTKALKESLKNRGSDLIFLILGEIRAVPDVLWGQLHRTQRALRTQLELNDFQVLRDAVWSQEKGESTAFIIELNQRTLPAVKKHLGPPLERQQECDDFVTKYLHNNQVVAGPYIEEGRWIVEVKRKFIDAVEMLKAKTKAGGRDIGVANLISAAIGKDSAFSVNEKIAEFYEKNGEFAVFLTEFLSGKPLWLKTK
ncbi:MAG: CCA tRNA nucleotidyltransferase [Candidatus Bathyarchaeia archaeon]